MARFCHYMGDNSEFFVHRNLLVAHIHGLQLLSHQSTSLKTVKGKSNYEFLARVPDLLVDAYDNRPHAQSELENYQIGSLDSIGTTI